MFEVGLVVVGMVIGAVVGALVYRNNLKDIEDEFAKYRDAIEAEIGKLKSKLSK